MSETLNPMTLPLRGSRLIEASAGTGKTWTIAALYLRLVLGHGEETLGRALMPAEILVMTFTKAATRELSDRIRQRLVQAAACFRGEAGPDAEDAFLTELLAAHPEGAARREAAWRLATAAEAMDDAAVFTIDAWCQRMLREHAFDSGCLFDEKLQANQAAMRAEAARDYWRQQVYPLADEALGVALKVWKDVDALAASAKGLAEMPLPAGAGAGSLADVIARATRDRSQALASLKQGWVQRAHEMQAWLDAQMARKDCAFHKVKLKAVHYTAWLNDLRDWAQRDVDAAFGVSGTGCIRLTPAGLQAVLKPDCIVDPPPAFAAFESLVAALAQLPDPAAALRAHAAARITERLQQLQAQAGTYGFADMLQRLDQALDEAVHGEHARRLRQRILTRYPVALIDEFQDTSPLQLRIFDRLYRMADNDPAQALLLIGDPKQSIYGFRGADIHSYLRARQATEGRHHVLGTNHRSSAALVAAVNGLFAQAEARDAHEGAFMFPGAAGEGGVPRPGLPFVPVAARGRRERFVTAQGDEPPVVMCVNTEISGQPDSCTLFAALGAERAVALLNDPQAGFMRDDGAFTRLRPADIAVLVRTAKEAQAMQAALRRRGVASVFLSDQDTVFATDEAADLWRLLRAVAAPRDVRLARAAFATALVDWPLDELLALASDDTRFDARCELLVELNATWQSQGVLAMLRRALHGFDLPARWLAAADGERRLTNVLHLAELLQAASAQLDGEQALIRWLSQQIDDAEVGGFAGGGADDAQVLRLESDADLVQVVTVHKSKGLEYPVVLLPFAAHHRAVERRNTPHVLLPGDDGERQLFLSPTAAQLAEADTVRLREDLRLLYVALTRARHALWLGVAALKRGVRKDCTWHCSAIGRLVSGSQACEPAQLAHDLHRLAQTLPGLRVDAVPLDGDGKAAMPGLTRLQPREAAPPLRPAPAYAAVFDRAWSVGSYSALVKGSAGGQAVAPADPPLRVLRDDEPAEPEATVDARRPGDAPWHRFPRGAFAGNFLHDQLEWLADEGFALDEQPALQSALLRRCERQGWGHRGDDVLAWLRAVCTTPLPPLGTSLAGLARGMAEMEFWFPSDGLDTQRLDALCREHVLPGRPRPALPERRLRGMLMGFADLVFEHDGRYGVLDYKSNALGARDADYTPAAMEAAMLAHRYDVQAVLYLLALHRLLKLRLGRAYAAATHLHGAVYLFLRGVHGPAAGCLHLPPPIALLEALDAMLAQPAGVAEGEAA